MTNDHLTQFLESLKTDLINSLQANGKHISSQTVQQLTVVSNGTVAQLQIPGYLQILETGRKPTSKNAVKSNPPMIQRIQEWCRANGIPDKAAWAIKKSIDKNGYKGIPGLLTQPLSEENINLRLDPILQNLANHYAQKITDNF